MAGEEDGSLRAQELLSAPSLLSRPGLLERLSARSSYHSKSTLYDVFVWARRELISPFWRFSAPAVVRQLGADLTELQVAEAMASMDPLSKVRPREAIAVGKGSALFGECSVQLFVRHRSMGPEHTRVPGWRGLPEILLVVDYSAQCAPP